MLTRVRFSSFFDLIGGGALISAAAALSGGFLLSTIANTILFSIFLTCFALSVSAFLMARVVQIAGVVIRNPNSNQHSRRVSQAVLDIGTVTAMPAAETEASELQRAA
jgi:hypothetical protein